MARITSPLRVVCYRSQTGKNRPKAAGRQTVGATGIIAMAKFGEPSAFEIECIHEPFPSTEVNLQNS
jgi:hypothetical protein